MIYIRTVIIFFLLMTSVRVSFSQTHNLSSKREFKQVESFIESKSLINLTVERLVLEIVKPEWNDEEKAYAIFYWLASNIKYDYEGFESGYWKKYPSDSLIAQDTYMYRKGVCSGYAHLFKLMCTEIGLESKTIDGFSRSEIYQAGLPIEVSDHTWNVVKVNKKWEFVDVTWGSSTAGNEKVNRYYFLTSADEFISNHFPEEIEWQLVKLPVTKEEFNKFPYISWQYFDLNFGKNFPKNGLLKCNKGMINVCISNSPELDILLKIYDYKAEKWIQGNISITKQKAQTNIQIKFTDRGKYLLEIDGMRHESGSYNIVQGILYYTIINDK
jgi:transglutaminase/protease-like cytokinesis protein 3